MIWKKLRLEFNMTKDTQWEDSKLEDKMKMDDMRRQTEKNKHQ